MRSAHSRMGREREGEGGKGMERRGRGIGRAV